jgi:hypothetical protein
MCTRKSPKRQKGQSLVELSVLISAMVILLAGVADFGRGYLIFIELRDAAQEGASYGSYSPDDFVEIEARVRDTIQEPIDLSDPSVVTVVSTLTNPSQACSGFDPVTLEPNEIEVTILYQLRITMPFLGSIFGSQEFPLEARVKNTILQPPCE